MKGAYSWYIYHHSESLLKNETQIETQLAFPARIFTINYHFNNMFQHDTCLNDRLHMAILLYRRVNEHQRVKQELYGGHIKIRHFSLHS